MVACRLDGAELPEGGEELVGEAVADVEEAGLEHFVAVFGAFEVVGEFFDLVVLQGEVGCYLGLHAGGGVGGELDVFEEGFAA